MNVLDLFSGIGGFSLGLERAGMRTVAFCEIDQACHAVLRKHWPNVPIYDDVRTLTAERLAADGIGVDVICGGFPCQDISFAGKGAGIEGERSGLWSEYARIIGEVRPKYVIVENVSALLGRGLDRVLGDLATLGFDAEWHCIPASALGAPHRRDRLWLVAYPARIQPGRQEQWPERERAGTRSQSIALADAAVNGRVTRRPSDTAQEPERRQPDRSCVGAHVANADEPRLERWLRRSLQERADERAAWQSRSSVSDADREQMGWTAKSWPERGQWLVEPPVGRVANGIPGRVDRLKQLGNAVVPDAPEIIGSAIIAFEENRAVSYRTTEGF